MKFILEIQKKRTHPFAFSRRRTLFLPKPFCFVGELSNKKTPPFCVWDKKGLSYCYTLCYDVLRKEVDMTINVSRVLLFNSFFSVCLCGTFKTISSLTGALKHISLSEKERIEKDIRGPKG